MTKTIAGLFEDFDHARDAMHDLQDIGFKRSDISLAAANINDRYDEYVEERVTHDNIGKAAADGALAGGAVGGIGGVLAGLGLFAIPGIGPVVAVGPIVSGLVGLMTGAVTGSLLAALVEAGIDEEDAEIYAEGVRRGYTLLTVTASDADAAHVADIMNEHGAVDIDRRAASWREEDWEGYDPDEPFYTRSEYERERNKFDRFQRPVA